MSLYEVIGYHVTLMIANHPIYGGDWLSCDPLIFLFLLKTYRLSYYNTLL